RSRWNREQIAEGIALVERALATRRFGAYTLQAAIAAVHAEAATAAETDWAQIVALYDALLRIEPSPVIELNRAAAVAMHDGPESGLRLIDAIRARRSAPPPRQARGSARRVRKSALSRRAGAGEKISFRPAVENRVLRRLEG